MKRIIDNYLFNAAARTVTLLDLPPVALALTQARVLLITNVTRGAVIYNPHDSTTGATVSGNVLTLSYDTSAQANTDALLIVYEDPAAVAPMQQVGDARTAALLQTVLIELRVMSALLLTGLNLRDELESLRADAAANLNLL